MRKIFTLFFCMVLSISVLAQQKIQMRSADKAECTKSDMTSLNAVFSFSGIEANELQSERGVFSTLSMPNTVIGGNVGDPQIPVVNKLIAVPVGATPNIRVTSYSTTEYDLEDLGIHKLSPRQPDVTKDQKPEFVYNASAYQKRGLSSEPVARVSVNGTMRGVQVGQFSIEPVSYDPANNKIRVFNDIEVEVSFDGADAKATEDMLVKTYSPYFDILYKQLFNGRVVRDVYEDHPDLWKSPVRMLVIANRMFENCIQDWVAWKTTKGIYVDLNYTDDIGTSASAIKSFIQTKYADYAPTFLVIMGDQDQVIPSIASASQTSCVSDLDYSSVDGDEFVDMFHSRISAETTAEMTAILNKALEYEQYTMPDPSYLNNVLLIAGADSGWGITVGRPTIWYATNYYYNTEHGFSNVYEYTTDDYTNCYSYLSSGVGFANYTAHGSKTSWADPSFTVSDVANLTNAHKYFYAIGNCCQSGDWGYSTTCYGEALVRAENKGAFAYIGSCPNTVWLNDYYFGVGPTSRADGTMPSYDETGTGIYDAIWMDDVYNTVNSVLYVGNLAGNAANALGYEMHKPTLYYWQAYHVIGDGTIMPYRVQPTANQVSHMAILPIGMTTYEVSAVPGSYVAISKDGVLHGTGLVGETGTVVLDITPVTSGGDVTICVTAPNRIPYVQTVPAAALEGPYISMDSYTPTSTHVGDNTNLSITFKNVGTAATTGNTNITLTSDDVEIIQHTGSFGPLAAEGTTTVSGFSFKIAEGVADGTNVTIHYVAENGEDVYEGNIVVKANEAKLEYAGMTWQGGFTPGETITLTAKFKNTGHYQATNAEVRMDSSSNYLTFSNQPINLGTIAVNEEVSCQFSVTIDANCPETEVIPVIFTMNADGGLSATGNENLKNACNVVFNLIDSYGDGWNGAALVVSFSDGSESQSLTFSTGSSASYTLEIGNGTHVTLTWTSGSYDGECSFNVQYEGDLTIFEQTSRPNAGVLYEFDCNCAAATQTYNVTVASDNTEHGTVSGGGEFSFGESCTVTATPADGYMFTGWTWNGSVVSGLAEYTFSVTSDMDLVAHFGQGVLIGDGSEATNTYLPSYNYYNNSLSEQIYTAEELGAPGFITSIAFYNGGAEKTLDYDFYMKATTKSSFSSKTDWIAVSSDDKVFSGQVTVIADGWTIITLDTPFIFDGASNVVLVADKSTQYTSSPHMECRVFNTSTNQAIYAYDDNLDFDPTAPNSSSANSNNMLSVKNQLMITKESLGDCVRPTQLTANEVGPDFVKLSWTENGASEEWVVVCGDRTVTATTNEGFIIDELDSETEYTIKVRPACDENMFSNPITITTLENCPIPQNIVVSDISRSTATVTWGGYNDSYEVQLGVPAFLISEGFENGIPANWDNDATYPWTVVDGHIQSGNAGMSSSTSSISATVTYPDAGTLSFDFWSRGEGGDSNDWDKCRFYIDDELMFDYGSHSDWEFFTTEVAAGTHTFTWTYKKDSSVNPTGDCFIVDNVEMKSGETTWNNPIAVEDATYTFTGLNPLTTYCVRVQGFCGNTETGWSETIVFATNDDIISNIQAYSTNGGWYLITTPLAGETDVELVGNMTSNSFDLYRFNQEASMEWENWKADGDHNHFKLEPGRGYLYANSEPVTLIFSGEFYDEDVCPVTINNVSGHPSSGWNLIGNPYDVAATLNIARDFYVMSDENGRTDLILAQTDVIAPMEGIFVYTTDAEESVTFIPGSAKSDNAGNRIVVNLSNGEGNVIDRVMVRMGESNALPKYMLDENHAHVSIQQNGNEYAAVGVTDMDMVPVNFKADRMGTYTFTASVYGMDVDYLHLIDNVTGDDVDMLLEGSYTFIGAPSDVENRFVLRFSQNVNNNIFAYQNGNDIVVSGDGTLQVFDVMGRFVGSYEINGVETIEALPMGVYIFRMVGETIMTQKIVVR